MRSPEFGLKALLLLRDTGRIYDAQCVCRAACFLEKVKFGHPEVKLRKGCLLPAPTMWKWAVRKCGDRQIHR